MPKIIFILFLCAFALIANGQDTVGSAGRSGWQIINTQGLPEKREDCSFVEAYGLFYLLGGRGIKTVDVFDPKTNTWTHRGNTPVELNHFQAVAFKNKIYVIGAMNGRYPHEKPLENIYIYDTQSDTWQTGPAIPAGRLRGSGGTVVYKNKIYLVCGIQDGHFDGTVPWLDAFDPETGNWTAMADAPHGRHHFNAVVVGGKLYLASGRFTSAKTQPAIQLNVPEVDVYDFKKNTWTTRSAEINLPVPRAGSAAVAFKNQVVILGGEST